MIKTILQDKYDVDSFSFGEEFIVTLVSDTSTKKFSFGDRIVYFKFHEEELANPTNFSYYNLLGKSLGTTTLIQNTDSELLERIKSDTGDFYSADELKHYIIIAQNHIMEIVSLCSIEDFRINLSKKLAYIKLVDKSDWRESKPVSCVVYDFGHGKVILDEPGKPLFKHTNDGGSLFLLREQKLYLLDLHDFSEKPIGLKNIRIEASQSITLMKRHGNTVVLCVTSKKPSIMSKFFFGSDFIWLNEYFMGTFENDLITVNARIKELSNEGLGQIIFD